MFALIAHAQTQQTTQLAAVGYIAYGAGDFDGQSSGHDFYGVSFPRGAACASADTQLEGARSEPGGGHGGRRGLRGRRQQQELARQAQPVCQSVVRAAGLLRRTGAPVVGGAWTSILGATTGRGRHARCVRSRRGGERPRPASWRSCSR